MHSRQPRLAAGMMSTRTGAAPGYTHDMCTAQGGRVGSMQGRTDGWREVVSSSHSKPLTQPARLPAAECWPLGGGCQGQHTQQPIGILSIPESRSQSGNPSWGGPAHTRETRQPPARPCTVIRTSASRKTCRSPPLGGRPRVMVCPCAHTHGALPQRGACPSAPVSSSSRSSSHIAPVALQS